MGKKPRDGFYKRDGSPYWWTRDPVTGNRCSTGFKDKEAARRWRAARERMAADPAHAAAEAATLGEWCGRFVAWKEKSKSAATVSVARQKLGHWIRVFSASTKLSTFSEPSSVDKFVSQRRSENASDHTISKEVAHMLAVLKLAKRAKCFSGDLSTLRPPDLHAGYKPRKRALNRQELARLLAALEPRRGALVAVCVALGCRLGEAFRLLPTDITAERVFLRGTKTAESERFVPVLSLFKPLLAAAVGYLPLEPWGKVQRDLKVACKRAGIDPCSPNDLRRTHATLLAEAGVDADVTRRLLGHTTRNLVDRVYGQPSTESLAGLAETKLLGAAPLLPEEKNRIPESQLPTKRKDEYFESALDNARRAIREIANRPSEETVLKREGGRVYSERVRVALECLKLIEDERHFTDGPSCALIYETVRKHFGIEPDDRDGGVPGAFLPLPIEISLEEKLRRADELWRAGFFKSQLKARSAIFAALPELPPTPQTNDDQGPFWYEDVTISEEPAPSRFRSSEKQAKAPVAQWTEQRFPNPEPYTEVTAGILGFRGDARRWIPADEPGFGRNGQGSGTAVSQ